MSDPVGERLRSYYQSIQGDAPARLEARVSRGFDSASAARPARAPWRPAFGLLAAGAAVVIVALVVGGLVLVPAPTPSPTGITGPSASPTATESPSASATATGSPSTSPTAEPTRSPEPSGTPTHTATPTPSTIATPTPLNRIFARTGPMTPVTNGPSVTLLDGRVLIVGGMVPQSNGVKVKTNAAEIYDPGTDKFAPTGSMADARTGHTATLLKDGRVLVVGGADLSDGIDNLATAEIYDPTTRKFTRTGSMAHGRAAHTATLLADGRVLVTGGFGGGTNSLSSAEIYDPSNGTFSLTGSMAVTREHHTATLLPNGRVLVAGGLDDGATSANPGVVASADLFDPTTGTFSPTGSMTTPRAQHTATLLASGLVLIVGGEGADQATPLATAEVYNPATGRFSSGGSMLVARRNQTATLMKDGLLLIAGGDGLTTSEIYTPSTGTFGFKTAMLGQVSAAAPLQDGRVLLTGETPQLYPAYLQ